ncbi:transmembrane protein-like [Tropilaelaps mercedesae]|uniref:Transmembrane protein 192 n=1 Tax=Tropilaelaps mercedesae TaxID=418985 RepID=A0A1V9WZH8_9ACAR|nr:transmembrane protein-like [Tropilaelaps mercedesae]
MNAVGAMDTAPLCATLDPPDNRVQTSAVIAFQIFVMMDLLVLSFVLPYVPDLPLPVYSLIVYLNCGVWALSYILDAYLRRQHTLLSCYGFIDFYQKTKNLRRTALNVMSAELNHEFHRNKILPDIEPQDFITSILQTQNSAEIGYRDNGPVEDIVEKQSDMIRYLKQYNTFLKRIVLRLNQDLETVREQHLINV